MSPDELDALLADLRVFGADHQTIEAKRARVDVPETLRDSLIAMANADGGTVLLGVDERGGAFAVTGVEDPGRVSSALQSTCAELEPPLRPRITLVGHSDGTVVCAEFPPVPRAQRPCHRRVDGPHASSFVRVGDADQLLDPGEVDEMLAERSPHDHSRRLFGDARLDAEQVRMLAEDNLRAGEDLSALLRRFNAEVDEGVTVAGLLALGEEPATESPAARIAYRRTPQRGDPGGTRHQGRHVEGRVGQLLEATMRALRDDLPAVQVERNGDLFDEHDVPLTALREFVANALVHRSLTDFRSSASIAIEVADEAVTITSPGGLHISAEPSQLGLSPISSVRNLALVRICESLRTPTGARIVESQASGIRTADRACREARTLPALFVDGPTTFQVFMLRGVLDEGAAEQVLDTVGLDPSDADLRRVLAAAQRVHEARSHEAGTPLARAPFDARFVARLLSPTDVADAAAILRTLEEAGALTRRRTRRDVTWIPSPTSEREQPRTRARRSDRERVDAVVGALASSGVTELGRDAIGTIIERRSSRTQIEWITAAIEAGYVEPTRESPFDPHRAYRLTGRGRAYAARLNARAK